MADYDGDRVVGDGSYVEPESSYVETDVVRDPLVQEIPKPGWRRWAWLLIPFLLGIILLSWGLHRLRQAPPLTTAQQAIAQCQYQPEHLSLTSDDEWNIVNSIGYGLGMTTPENEQARLLTAAKDLCLAHLCQGTDSRLDDLDNIAADEFAFAVTPGGQLMDASTTAFLVETVTTAPWCHG